MMGRWTFLRVGLVVLAMLFFLHHRGFAEERYTVKPGDSLSKIAKSFGVSIEALRKINGLDGDAIKAKQVLLIPVPTVKGTKEAAKQHPLETESYVVKKGDTLRSISKRVSLSIGEIKRMNQLPSTSLKVGQILTLPKAGISEDLETSEELGDSEELTGQRVTGGSIDKQEAPGALGKWSNQEERNLFIRVVKTFLGAPYRLGGSTLKGIDCSAFVKRIYEIFDIYLPRTAREQLHIGKKVEKHELEEGDLVFFKARQPNHAHVGIYIGNNEFVHASNRNREVKVDNLDIPYFSKRFLKGVRIKELEQDT